MFVDFFIRRPVFATVCALLIILAGGVVIPTLPIAQFPNLAPPQVCGFKLLHGRQRADGRERSHHSARTADQRRGRNEVRHVVERQRRQQPDHGNLRPDPRPRFGSSRYPEPRQYGTGTPPRRCKGSRHIGRQEFATTSCLARPCFRQRVDTRRST